MKISAVVALLFAFSFAAAQSPSAQPTPAQGSAGQSLDPATDDNGTYTFHSNVPLVVLDVVVTDSHGAPVTDLTRADFHV
ncbi:MAG TPA: hypothetical protein VJU82_01130, partial [Acidobacteriaceae bacterium]|nr:hypothetical protein [Acidobacteriaceae bacterium]